MIPVPEEQVDGMSVPAVEDTNAAVSAELSETIPETDIDDSNGSTGEVADSCIEIIERILEFILYDENVLAKKILDYILS